MKNPTHRDQMKTCLERPFVVVRRCCMTFDAEVDRVNFARQSTWYFNVIERYNQAGYDEHKIRHLFQTMPRIISDALKQGLHSMRVLSSSRTTDELAAHHLFDRSTNLSNRIEDSIWDDQTDHAYIRIQYDPVTLHRKGVAFNKAFAHLNGLHTDEMAARIGNREMPFLACNEIDFLGGMVHYLLTSRMSRTERYGRMCGMDGRAYLARVVSLKDFDAAGRLIQVRFSNINQ